LGLLFHSYQPTQLAISSSALPFRFSPFSTVLKGKRGKQ
jgi:hypothetical protein